jgi:peptide deformylase
MNYSLVPESDPVLNLLASRWDWQEDGDPSSLIESMSTIMKDSGGVGIAAPQIGVSKRILLICHSHGNIQEYINPILTHAEGEVLDTEGCLSFPGLWLKVKRYQRIEVHYETKEKISLTRSLEEFEARVFQHELDHLDGTTFTKRVGSLTLALARKKQKKAKSYGLK